jgi:membrane fusion protein (multidrug efflux system)
MTEAVLSTTEPARRIGVRQIVAGVVVLALLGVVAYWFVAMRGRETTDDAFVEGHMVFLSPRVSGQVSEVLVDENTRVREGQVLVRLDPSDYEARVAHARADVDAARNRMSQSSAAAAGANAQGKAAGARLLLAEQELARMRGLIAQKVASTSQLESAVAVRDSAIAEVRAAEQREVAELAALGGDAPVRQAEAALREAELALAHTTITAPFDGVIGRKSVERGANVSPNQPLLALAADSGNWISANFKETQIGRMHLGDPVDVRVDAFPKRVWRGRIESISPATGAKYALLPPDNATGNFTKVVQRVPVRIALEAVPARDAPDVAAAKDTPWSGDSLPVGLSVNVSVRVR